MISKNSRVLHVKSNVSRNADISTDCIYFGQMICNKQFCENVLVQRYRHTVYSILFALIKGFFFMTNHFLFKGSFYWSPLSYAKLNTGFFVYIGCSDLSAKSKQGI